MKICSVTMSRSGRADECEGALATVHELADDRLRFAAGVVRDFSKKRNQMLSDAAKGGWDWAIMLDTDERINFHAPAEEVREALGLAVSDVLMVKHDSGAYEKERFFRLPPRGHFHGPTHECFISDEGSGRGSLPADLMTFSEIPKTAEHLHDKLERDRDLLEEYCEDHPDDPRWWYYLGDTYANLGRRSDAKEAFWECQLLKGWNEEAAWANFRIAEIEVAEKEYERALHSALMGMSFRADYPEFPWLIGWCCYQLGRHEQAIYWAEIALLNQTSDKYSERIGFRYPPAHYEAPWDLLRWSARALDLRVLEEGAERGFGFALIEQKRHNKTPAGGPTGVTGDPTSRS